MLGARFVGEHRDEADVDPQDVGELARQALEHAGAFGGGDGERGAAERVLVGELGAHVARSVIRHAPGAGRCYTTETIETLSYLTTYFSGG